MVLTRYLVIAQAWGQPAEVVRAKDLADAWRAAEQLCTTYDALNVSIVDVDGGVIIPFGTRPSEPPP